MYFDAHSDIFNDVTVRRLRGETDVFRRRHLDRLRRGGAEGGIFVIWVDPPYDADCGKRTHQIMDCIRAESAGNGTLRLVRTCAEMDRARRDGVFYAFVGVEGVAYAGNSLTRIDEYYDFGARHAMLTWNEANALAAGALSGETWGLTAAGRRAVRRLQEKGMLLDVSHLNEAGFWDVSELTAAPFIASHSNARALCDTPRNLTDDQLRAVRDADGVVGLNAYARFIGEAPEEQTVRRLALHAAHMAEVMGVDHVGCGFDFVEFLDDGDAPPRTAGLADAGEVPNLFTCLAELGMTAEELEKIARLNFQRVLRRTVG